MIDVAYENIIEFEMLDNTLEGRELLESKVSKTVGEGKNKGFQNVVKLYFDLDNAQERNIYFETEKYVSDNYESNKKYLLLQAPRGNSPYIYPSIINILYLIGINFKKNKKITKIARIEPISNIKNFIYELFEKKELTVPLKEIFFKILVNFYRYRILDKNVYLTLCTNFRNVTTKEKFDIKSFLKKYQNQNIFTIGFIMDGEKHLFCKNDNFINLLLTDNINTLDDSSLEKTGVCDFCKKTKKLIDNFGKEPFPLKNLKNFTSTMPSVLYENNQKTLEKNLRCCVDCFKEISQADYELDDFLIGTLREECISCKNKQNFKVYAFIDVPFKQEIDFEDIKYAMEYLFGNQNALDNIKKTVKSEEIFDEDWRVILNIFIAEKTDKINQTILNMRNINPHLFKKYNQIFEFINNLNEELTYRTWKGNFADIFSTISKADKRVSFEVFEAFFNEKELDVENLIFNFLPLIKRKFLASIDDKTYKVHYQYLLLDITNILIIDSLRKKEEVLNFEIMDLLESYVNDNGKTRYRKKDAKEMVKALGFDWSELEIGLFDLGMIIQECVSDIKSRKNTDIEKVFMRKMNFTGMSIDDIISYIGHLEQKFQDYRNFIYRLDNKRERLTNIGVSLNQKNIEITPQKSAYLIAFGYEFSITLSNKIGALTNQQKQEEKENGNE